MRRARGRNWAAVRGAAVAGGLLATVVGGCAGVDRAAPRCTAGQRLAIVAQSVPGAAYLPCIDQLPPGWQSSSFEVDDAGARFELRSDRADRPVRVTLADSCRRGRATAIDPRAAGVRSYLRVDSISPQYSGRFYDVFAGGCVTAAFSFDRGPHIALVDGLRSTVGLYSRRQLGQELEADLGVSLDP